MNENTDKSNNLSYQSVKGSSGASYSDDKLKRLNLPDLNGKRFLDLGCNAGFYCDFAVRQGATKVLGVDIDPSVIKMAREQVSAAEFSDRGWDNLPDEEFDVAIFLSAIHYAADPVTLADRLHSMLSNDGLLVVEGGLIDPQYGMQTNTLIPVWREVGDRCRHLSGGFTQDHLFRQFDWEVVGSSEPRGGDPVTRHVLHAWPAAKHPRNSDYHVNLLEFAQCLALSAETISIKQSSYDFVRALGEIGQLTPQNIEKILNHDLFFNEFVENIAFAVGKQRPISIRLTPSVEESLCTRVSKALQSLGIDSRTND